jgi:N-acetyl-gamma-glutamyl-phosphate reductase
MSYSVAVAGASGYAGGELLRLIAEHPELEVRTVTAHSNAGQPLIDVHPHLRSLAGLNFVETTAEQLAGHDVVMLALPHGTSGALAAQLDADTLVLDCGADHRLTSEADWARFYGGEYHGAWVYGLPELLHADGTRQRDQIAGARRIAVPGCNATTVSLALAPGIRSGVIDAHDMTAMLAVGSSGAGRALRTELLASEMLGAASPYAVGGTHRHIPEIVQNVRLAGAVNASLSFTPVLVPMSRGILATVTARLASGVSAGAGAGFDTAAARVRDAWELAYAAEPFVHVLPEGRFPSTASTLGANTALMGLAIDDDAHRVVVVVALDNLVKGTAGAAVQSLNLALGLPETLGLPMNGVAP